MLCQRKLGLGLLGLAILLPCTILAGSARAQDVVEKPVRIGMVGSLFTDVNPIMTRIGSVMFAGLMKQSTGMDGEMVTGGDPITLGKNLHDGKLDLAVFHGVEFAWAQQQYPDLKPLMLAITKYKQTQARIVVAKDGPIANFNELAGKTLIMPLFTREHCRLFLDRCCREAGAENPNKFFGKVTKLNIESALDEVGLGTVGATVVDAVALEKYEILKPGCAARLRVLKSSEMFPTGVIAYRDGGLKEEVLAKFRDGLVNGGATDVGKELFLTFQITSFDAVTEAYAQQLAEIIKIYPAPGVSPK
jgi:ABC-type phosphate/phosphonate transport system substrate-binding protein